MITKTPKLSGRILTAAENLERLREEEEKKTMKKKEQEEKKIIRQQKKEEKKRIRLQRMEEKKAKAEGRKLQKHSQDLGNNAHLYHTQPCNHTPTQS